MALLNCIVYFLPKMCYKKNVPYLFVNTLMWPNAPRRGLQELKDPFA